MSAQDTVSTVRTVSTMSPVSTGSASSPARTAGPIRVVGDVVGRTGLPRACAEPAGSLQRLAARIDDHADQLAAAQGSDPKGRVVAVRRLASALRLGAARLRAGTLPEPRERSR